MKIILICLLTAMLLNSCIESETKFIYNYYDNGNVKSKASIDKDSIKNGESIIYYPTGEIKSRAFFTNGVLNGLETNYFTNGSIESLIPYSEGKYHGLVKVFYPNKNIRWHCYHINDLRMGLSKEYFESDSGKLSYEVYYSAIIDRDRPMRSIEYDKKGNIIKDSKVLNVISSSDTLNLYDTAYLDIEIVQPLYDNIDALIGDYDSLFQLKDYNGLDTIQGANNHVRIPISFTKKGLQQYRFLVRDYVMKYDNDTIITDAQHNYFYHYFYIK